MKNYFTINRKLIQSALWLSEKFTHGQAWVDMIGLANHSLGFIRSRGVKVIVERGQLGWSEVQLAQRWKWSRGKVRRFLKELKEEQQIEQQKNNVTTLVSIANYELYQNGSTTINTPNGHQTDTKRYPNNKNNKEKKEKTLNQEVSFTFFWDEYHTITGKSKTDRSVTLKKWKYITLTDQRKAYEAIKKYFDWAMLEYGDIQFVKKARTYLNDRSWEDDLTIKRDPSKIYIE